MSDDQPFESRRKRGLGRGLNALFGDDVAETTAPEDAQTPSRLAGVAAVDVPVEHLDSGRFQPRMDFDEEALQDLADSIRAKGVLQPILVRRLPENAERFEIIAGERRWRAAQLAQVHNVPVLIRDFSDQEAAEVALIENLQRRDLNPLEEAEGYKRLMEDFQRSQEEVASALGKSRSHLANMVRLLNLPDPVKGMLRQGSLSAGHARALLNASDAVALAEQVVKKGLNVRQTERLATEKGGVRARKPRAAKEKDADTLALERDLSNLLGLRVAIEFQGRGGQVTIHYETLEQLDDILYRLNNPPEGAPEDEDPLETDGGLDDGGILDDVAQAVGAVADDAEADLGPVDASGEGAVAADDDGAEDETEDEALLDASADAWAADLAESTAREREEMLAATLDADDEDSEGGDSEGEDGASDIEDTPRRANG